MKRRDFCQVAGLAAGALMIPTALARSALARPGLTRSDGFRLQVATTNRFAASDLVIDNEGRVDRTLAPSDLEADTTYYWRIADDNLQTVDLILARDYGYFKDRMMLTHLIEMYNGLTLPWVIATYGSSAVGVEAKELPQTVELRQNYPNPFRERTTVPFELPERASVRITVFNILGQSVAVLIDDQLPAGRHEAVWNPETAASGAYVYVLEAGEISRTRQMTLVK